MRVKERARERERVRARARVFALLTPADLFKRKRKAHFTHTPTSRTSQKLHEKIFWKKKNNNSSGVTKIPWQYFIFPKSKLIHPPDIYNFFFPASSKTQSFYMGVSTHGIISHSSVQKSPFKSKHGEGHVHDSLDNVGVEAAILYQLGYLCRRSNAEVYAN